LSEADTDANGNMAPQHTNVYASGSLITTYDNNGLHFYLNDWLGTRRVQTDYEGVLEQTCTSLPFGDMLSCTNSTQYPTEQHFTGKERDTESGNDYFGARYYGSTVGRFTSPDDDSGQNALSPQSLNLYSYAQNNPITNTDSDGNDCVTQVRINSSTEAVFRSDGQCTGANGDGVTQTYVPGTVTSVQAGANGTSIDIGYTPYGSSPNNTTADLNVDSAPGIDHPGIAFGPNMSGYNSVANTNYVVNRYLGPVFAAETAAMGGLLGDTMPATMLTGGSALGDEANAAAIAEKVTSHAFAKHAGEFRSITRNEFSEMVWGGPLG
jgi:RHS repeat-associated protein